jgi:hypothetical protein
MSAAVTPLGHDQEGWRSIDENGALHFRMRHDGGAILCIVPRRVLLTLAGVHGGSSEEDTFRAFEHYLARFEAMANAQFAAGEGGQGEITLDEAA